MSIELNYFLARFMQDVPAQDGVPTAVQYENAVRDAVATFNDRYGTKKLHSFSTVSGQAAYTLPDDYWGLIHMEPFFKQPGNVMITADGLVPLMSGSYIGEETYLVNGLTLTIDPTPAYALPRRLWYRAGHVLSDTGGVLVYPSMTERFASIIYVKAQANAWRIICGQVSRNKAWKYQMGDVMIDKTKVGDALKGWIADLDSEFDERVTQLIGPLGGLG